MKTLPTVTSLDRTYSPVKHYVAATKVHKAIVDLHVQHTLVDAEACAASHIMTAAAFVWVDLAFAHSTYRIDTQLSCMQNLVLCLGKLMTPTATLVTADVFLFL